MAFKDFVVLLLSSIFKQNTILSDSVAVLLAIERESTRKDSCGSGGNSIYEEDYLHIISNYS